MQIRKASPETFNAAGVGNLPGLLGIEVLEVGPGLLVARMPVRPDLRAPNGYLHAGAVVTLADTAAGYGCAASLPEGAQGFTTLELKSNHLGTARDGSLHCTARAVHLGRTTQVWDAEVRHAEGERVIALFRCTQMLLYPGK